MAHSHEHHHAPNHLNRAFSVGIALNLGFVIIEFITGFYTNSLALLSDAGHNLSDVATLALSLFAFIVARRKATSRYTYGFHRGTILASLANAVILLIAVGSIGWEAIQRFIQPVPTQGKVISAVAAIGIVINALSALLFFRNKDHDLNVRGAYLHLALDAVVSLGVVVSGLAILYTGATWIDPLISLVIMAVVIYSTWGLLTESLRLSLDAVPDGIDVTEIKHRILQMQGIRDVYHIHIWAMGTTKNAMTAHLLLEENLDARQVEKIKLVLKRELKHLNIHHVTLETENRLIQPDSCEHNG
jgi:cobalt-zinc-cadmium efflux system protein